MSVRIGSSFLACMAIGIGGRAHAGPDALQLMQKANGAYWGARTFQATYVCVMSMAGKGTMSVVIDLKAIPGKKTYVRIEPAGRGSGELGSTLR